MRARECNNIDCPYCFTGVSLRGKRVGLCGMPRPFIQAICPAPKQAVTTT